MQVADQEVPVLNKLTELEQKIGELAVPCTETTIVRAFGPKGEVFYAVQGFRHVHKPLDYFAIRLRKLGHIRYIGNRERPIYVSPLVLSESYDPRINAIHAIINTAKKTISIGPHSQGGLAAPEDRGMGLGSYALSLLIRWLKFNYPDYRVSKTTLAAIEQDDEERERRDRFLTHAGLSVVYTDQNGKGYFYANTVQELQEHINSEKVEAIGIDGLFSSFTVMQEWHKDLSNDYEALRKAHQKNIGEVARLRRKTVLNAVLFLIAGLAIGVGVTLASYLWFPQLWSQG